MLLPTNRQAFTLLAALRFFQQNIERVDDEIRDIASNAGEVESLTPDEIDELCQDINPSTGHEMFYVAWCIDIDAPTPQAAAEKALQIQRNPESIATAFLVRSPDGDVSKVDFEELKAQVESEPEETPPPPAVTAEIVIDGSSNRHVFDCTEWLRQADIQQLVYAAEQAFGSSEYTDSIPYFYEKTNELVASIVTYAAAADLPFDVTIEPKVVLSWLKANRPDAYPQVLDAYNTIQF